MSTDLSVPAPLLQTLLTVAVTDGTTGLLRSTAWRARADALLRRGEHGWVLLLADLDRFARLNATHGHPAADHVLARVGAALRQVAGPGGVAGRFGGDEFVLLVPLDATTSPRTVAEAARRAVAALDVTLDGPAGPLRITGVTASVGAATGTDLTALLWNADRALYSAKRAGGDAVDVAP